MQVKENILLHLEQRYIKQIRRGTSEDVVLVRGGIINTMDKSSGMAKRGGTLGDI